MVSNLSCDEIILDPGTLLAWWTSQRTVDITHDEKRNFDHVEDCHMLASDETPEQKEHWQSGEEHLSLEVEGVELNNPDPPTEATLSSLKQFRAKATADLATKSVADAKAVYEEIIALIAQIKRLSVRIAQHERTKTLLHENYLQRLLLRRSMDIYRRSSCKR